ncbi:hypothetical protein [Amycolatopsis kentuckyensis]|uniref:hypothetical protein n=1 Tax=Amycolatopsis kentuckyensis TaxID=218823 RepID=UPI0011789AE9|nr:hypothetical protein [Amycolatopsis kentuckyensis]
MHRVKRVLGVLTAVAAVLVGSGGVALASNDSVESVTSCPDWLRGYPSCANTLTSVNLRTGASSKSGYILTMPGDYPFSLGCWTTGEPINGDSVWYYGLYQHDENAVPVWTYGWVTGYWLATGHDPAPGIAHC